MYLKSLRVLFISLMMAAFVSGCVATPGPGRVLASVSRTTAPDATVNVARALTHGLAPYGIEVDRVREKLGVITLKTQFLKGASETTLPNDRRRFEKAYGVALDTSIILHNGGMDILFTLRGDFRDELGVVHGDIHQRLLRLARIISRLTGYPGEIRLTPTTDVGIEEQPQTANR